MLSKSRTLSIFLAEAYLLKKINKNDSVVPAKVLRLMYPPMVFFFHVVTSLVGLVG